MTIDSPHSLSEDELEIGIEDKTEPADFEHEESSDDGTSTQTQVHIQVSASDQHSYLDSGSLLNSSPFREVEEHLNARKHKKYNYDKKLPCDKCDKKYSSKSSLSFHKSSEHAQQTPPVNLRRQPKSALEKCKFCDKSVLHMGVHLATFHSNILRYKCNKCSFATKYSGNLRSHENSVS